MPEEFNKRDKFIEMIVEQRGLARHWKYCHYDAARYYKNIDNILGLPSVILATIILGFAFYSVDRNNVDLWVQITLASLTVLQGVFLTVQLYLKPSYLAESHKNSAQNLGTIGRRWEFLKARLDAGEEVSRDEIEEMILRQDAISKASETFPKLVLKNSKLRLNDYDREQAKRGA